VASSPHDSTGLVLIFEEHPFIQKLIVYNLERRGYTVLVSDHLAQFLMLAESHSPSLILIELSFAKSGDWEVLNALNENPSMMGLPVILLTSLSQEDMHFVGPLPPNIAATMIKPIVPDHLLGLMREVLSGNGHGD
jgi:DNA-binding response OmpR family regulator